mmetsp:Transcript_21625/g.65629  ORF Transcript_21625/g.65629 Transcript_21625/m.65629 type:complete len:100 (+) Transcript_21625:1156-1455(+)
MLRRFCRGSSELYGYSTREPSSLTSSNGTEQAKLCAGSPRRTMRSVSPLPDCMPSSIRQPKGRLAPHPSVIDQHGRKHIAGSIEVDVTLAKLGTPSSLR